MVNVKKETISNVEVIRNHVSEFIHNLTDKNKHESKIRYITENASALDVIVQLENGKEVLASIHEINGWSVSVLVVEMAERGTFEF